MEQQPGARYVTHSNVDCGDSSSSSSSAVLIPTTVEERGETSTHRHHHPGYRLESPVAMQYGQRWHHQQPVRGVQVNNSYPANYQPAQQQAIERHQWQFSAYSRQFPVTCQSTLSTTPGAVDRALAIAESHSNKICGVCGDVAKSYHFGGLSCDSCKAFFRRSVQNDNYRRFQCYHSGHCVLSINNRKSCQYCRMQRCLSIGMEKSWVMTEDERKALMRSRSQKKLMTTTPAPPVVSQTPPRADDYVPTIERMTDHLSMLEIKEIESIVTKYAHSYQQVPYRKDLSINDNDRPGFQIMEMFGTLIRRFAYYARLMPDFTSLPSDDQRLLLKGGVFEMCLLRGALVYDADNNRWPNTRLALYKDAPVLKSDNITHLASSHLFRMHIEFIGCMKQLNVDEATVMLLVLIVLFTERKGLLRPQWVERYQAYYVSVMERYLDWRYGPAKAKPMFCKLLAKLSDLRELSESHDQTNVHLGNEEISSIQQQLKHLDINPYPEFNIMPIQESSSPQQDLPIPSGSQVQHHQLSAAYSVSSTHHQQENYGAIPKAVLNQPTTFHSSWTFQQYQASSRSSEASNQVQQQLPTASLQGLSPAQVASDYQQRVHLAQQSQSNVQPHQFQNAGPSIAESAGASTSSPPDGSFKSSTETGAYFARALHQSVSQVVDQPHFGYEWVQADYRFHGFGEVLDQSAEGHQSSPGQSSGASIGQPNSDPSVGKQLLSSGPVDRPSGSRLTPEIMEELYYELERYSELNN